MPKSHRARGSATQCQLIGTTRKSLFSARSSRERRIYFGTAVGISEGKSADFVVLFHKLVFGSEYSRSTRTSFGNSPHTLPSHSPLSPGSKSFGYSVPTRGISISNFLTAIDNCSGNQCHNPASVYALYHFTGHCHRVPSYAWEAPPSLI